MLPTPDYTKFSDDNSILVETLAFLVHQRQKSISDNGICSYRGPNGLKCAVGYWIPDELYAEKYETKTIDDVVSIFSSMNPSFAKFINDNIKLFGLLQKLHDSSYEEISLLEDLYHDQRYLSILIDLHQNMQSLPLRSELKAAIVARATEMDAADPELAPISVDSVLFKL